MSYEPYLLSTHLCSRPQIVAARPEGGHWEGVELWQFNWRALYAIPIIVFGFNR